MRPVSSFGHYLFLFCFCFVFWCFFVLFCFFNARAKKIFVPGENNSNFLFLIKKENKIKDIEVFLVLLKLRSR